MNRESVRAGSKRVIAAVCAIALLGGGGVWLYSLRAGNEEQPAVSENAVSKVSAGSSDDSTISAGGTISAAQLSDGLGMSGTSVRLTVESVLAESGDTVSAGTELYKITEDSLAKAEKTLQSELQSAKDALVEQKSTYQLEKSKAETLYQSELLLGDSVNSDYESGLTSLDKALEQAYEDYQSAQSTVNNTPSKISSKQSELNSKQSQANELEERKNSIQNDLSGAKSEYSSAAEKYNSVVAEYNAAAGTVRYLGNALGKDVSGITLSGTVSAAIKEQNTSSGAGKPEGMGDMSGRGDAGGMSFDRSSFFDMVMSDEELTVTAVPETEIQDGAAVLYDGPVTESVTEPAAVSEMEPQKDQTAEILNGLYDKAYEEYVSKKDSLDKAQSEYKSAENRYNELSSSLNETSSELTSVQNEVNSINKEISSLNSELSTAKKNLTKLKSEYNSLKASYETDKLELKNTFDTDTASYENAEYHYKITLATLEDDLAKAQDAYDTAEANVKIFEDDLADGYIRAKQDGVIYSLQFEEGRNADVKSPFVYYVDQSAFSTTVELDQNDVTQVSIGDKVVIYSSESGMTNGKITAISAGESTSLADVRFNVTVTADEGANLYVGQSVNVYFNYSGMKSGDFSDFKGSGKSDGDSGKGSGRPDFSGGMPEGFDMSSMPDFANRKDR